MKKKMLQMLIVCVMMMVGGVFNTADAQHRTNTTRSRATTSIIGTWVTDGMKLMGTAEEGMEFKKAKIYFTFSQDSSAKFKMQVEGNVSDDNVKLEMGVELSMPGVYKKSGNELTVNFDKSSKTIKVTKFNIICSPEVKEALKAAGYSEEALKKEFAEQMKSNLDFNDIFGNATIQSLTGNTMILSDGKNSMNFTRVVNSQRR